MWGDDGNFSSLMTLDGLDEDDEFYEFRNLTKELAAAEKEEEEELLTSAANSDWGLVWPAAVYPPNETKPWPNEMMSDEPSQNNPPPPHPPNQHAKPVSRKVSVKHFSSPCSTRFSAQRPSRTITWG